MSKPIYSEIVYDDDGYLVSYTATYSDRSSRTWVVKAIMVVFPIIMLLVILIGIRMGIQ